MSGGLSQCCVSGHIHAVRFDATDTKMIRFPVMPRLTQRSLYTQGSPKGTFEDFGGLRTYVSKPEDGSKARSVVFLPDIFGVDIPNAQLLADVSVDCIGSGSVDDIILTTCKSLLAGPQTGSTYISPTSSRVSPLDHLTGVLLCSYILCSS